MKKKRFEVDDGFRPELLAGASFDGIMEIPVIEKPSEIVIPDDIVPFSQYRKVRATDYALCFNDMDITFSDVIRSPEEYLVLFSKFESVISPDVSLYRDQPLSTQIANIYRNRMIGHYYQSKGLYVIPQIRWGDERTYTTMVLPEKVAFLGVRKHSIVYVSTYGCIRGKENKMHFRNGLEAMLEELEPVVVLVYGSMPDSVFGDFWGRTKFISYPDWISKKRRRTR
ncbi:MAG: DUF4417 domain-containing protein [Lachnospiraceae bacterium]|nr:DUF4417 domain-containing protein [Lachnospiraceae bacterium]